jgi:hypothetical protein
VGRVRGRYGAERDEQEDENRARHDVIVAHTANTGLPVRPADVD